MKFYLGTHKTYWLWRPEFREVPLFVSHRQLAKRAKLYPNAGPFALDSGGFSQLTQDPDGWPPRCEEPYVDAVRGYVSVVGSALLWASQQDWMVEPWLLHGRSVLEHQERTVANYLRLTELAPEVPWTPVLQGWELADYHQCADLFESAGVRLAELPTVGVGSVCRRESTDQIGAIINSVCDRGYNVHGFGVKSRGLKLYGDRLYSADSMAWSFNARHEPRPTPGCHHGIRGMGRCNNCPRYALAWRSRLLERNTLCKTE